MTDKEAAYQVVIVLEKSKKNPYLYILTNMLLNFNGYYTKTFNYTTYHNSELSVNAVCP